jgi:hypothetical protein
VCSLFDKDGNPTVVCPTRFKEGSLIVSDAASFFFLRPPGEGGQCSRGAQAKSV